MVFDNTLSVQSPVLSSTRKTDRLSKSILKRRFASQLYVLGLLRDLRRLLTCLT